MTEDFGDDFFEQLKEIGKAVDKWPEWKRTGWAILDLKDENATPESVQNARTENQTKF